MAIKHEIKRVLVLSTEHLTREVVAAMEQNCDYCKAVGEYGAYFWIPEIFPDDAGPTDPYDGNEDLPECIRKALDYARALGCKEVEFDSDGPLMPDLDAYPDVTYPDVIEEETES